MDTNKNKDNKLSFIYANDILPFAKAQENLTFITGNECINCCGKNHLSIKGLSEILEDGKCISCNKETKVFIPFIARQVIQKYGFGTNEYFKIKQIFVNDCNGQENKMYEKIKYETLFGTMGGAVESIITDELSMLQGFLNGIKNLKQKYDFFDEIDEHLVLSEMIKEALKELKGSCNPSTLDKKAKEYLHDLSLRKRDNIKDNKKQ